MARKRNPAPAKLANGPPARRSGSARLLIAGALLVAAFVVGFVAVRRATKSASPSNPAAPPIVEAEKSAFAAYAGSESCRECHEQAYDLWKKSNHGFAERLIKPEMERIAFDPPRRFRHGSQSSEARIRDGQYEIVTLGYSNKVAAYPVDRVIGHNPLRQFLTPQPGGRWQVQEASYDPITNEWFNVYGEEDRKPGEWGHWTGRGMNWNNMCATCHNTRLRKNYDVATDSYHTTMVEPTVGCEACHGPLKAHVRFRKVYPDKKVKDPTIPPLSAFQYQGICGSCHSRRHELTGDFKPGDSFFDHFSLTIVDATDVYHPDGQIRDEDYEFASLLSSRMRRAEIRCLDCHNPHSMKTLTQGNDLCMRCHNGSYTNAPKVDPIPHSLHSPTNNGSLCVTCHMPTTPYMQRHWRHDHGFTIPDPLLTKQYGIPNACNRCHQDKTADWSLEYCDEWYGTNMLRHTRERAQWIVEARRGNDAVRAPLVRLLNSEEPFYWKAVTATLLEPWVGEPNVTQALLAALKHVHPLVREKAVRALDPLAESGHADVVEPIRKLLNDPVRSVRVAAAWALRATLDPQSLASRELEHSLEHNADQPTGQLQQGVYCLARQQLPQAVEHFQKAITWDPNSAPLRHEMAVVLSMMGRNQEALQQIQAACQLEPKEAEYQFKLGLALAELNEINKAVTALREAIRLNPRHARAWYNLGLALNSQGKTDEALESLGRGETVEPRDPRIPYARATILARLGKVPEARAAARRALELQRDFAAAEELLRSLP